MTTDPDDDRRPASERVLALLDGAPPRLRIGALLERLGEHAFGLAMLLLGLVGVVPGLSMIAGLALLVVAARMILSAATPMPRFIADRTVPTARLVAFVGRAAPVLRALERPLRPRLPACLAAARAIAGPWVAVLALAMTIPIPLSNIPPALAVVAIALASLARDGMALAAALAVSAALAAFATFEGWAVLHRVASRLL